MRLGRCKKGDGEHSEKTHTHLGNLKHSNKNEKKKSAMDWQISHENLTKSRTEISKV